MRLWAVVAITALAAAAVLGRAAHLLPSDAYLALVCGRHIAQHGLPVVDTLATLTRGQPWVDEQWLGQLAIYGLERLGGLRVLLAGEALVTGAAFAITARHALHHASSFVATALASCVGIFFCAIFFGVRPQMFALPMFAAILSVIGEERPPRALLWTLPLLVLWANVHGSVLFAAGLIGLRAAVSLFIAARERQWKDAALFALAGALAGLSPFASPYAARLPGYFAAVWHLQDPARHLPIEEWTPLTWSSGWLFFLAAGVALVLFAIKRTHRFAAAVLLLTALASWRANRNVQWFGLAFAAYLPALLPPLVSRLSLRGAQVCATVGVGVALASVVHLATRTDLERDLPSAALPALHRALLAQPEASAIMSDRFADWALWHEPLLEGRIAFDVRFELLDDDAARNVDTFLFARPGWQRLFPQAQIALLSKRLQPSLSEQFTRLPNARTVWESNTARLLVR